MVAQVNALIRLPKTTEPGKASRALRLDIVRRRHALSDRKIVRLFHKLPKFRDRDELVSIQKSLTLTE